MLGRQCIECSIAYNPRSNQITKVALPPKLSIMNLLRKVQDLTAMRALGSIGKRFYSLGMPQLHNTVVVSAHYHANIPKLIRTLEPHLSIAQSKKLKLEGKYRGQQETYAAGVDWETKPLCSSFVRQFVVGLIDPGKRHRPITVRYVEEAMKNMENLEIVDFKVLNQ